MAVYRFKGNDSEMKVMSKASMKALTKLKKDSNVTVKVNLPKTHMKFIEKTLGYKASNEVLLKDFINKLANIKK